MPWPNSPSSTGEPRGMYEPWYNANYKVAHLPKEYMVEAEHIKNAKQLMDGMKVIYAPILEDRILIQGRQIFTGNPYKLVFALDGSWEEKIDICFKIATQHINRIIDSK